MRHLAGKATIEKGVAVVEIDDTAGGVRVVAIGPQGPFGIQADAVIVATPTFVANRIVRARRPGTSTVRGTVRGTVTGSPAGAAVDGRGRAPELQTGE